jgi:hypothetical protein
MSMSFLRQTLATWVVRVGGVRAGPAAETGWWILRFFAADNVHADTDAHGDSAGCMYNPLIYLQTLLNGCMALLTLKALNEPVHNHVTMQRC